MGRWPPYPPTSHACQQGATDRATLSMSPHAHHISHLSSPRCPTVLATLHPATLAQIGPSTVDPHIGTPTHPLTITPRGSWPRVCGTPPRCAPCPAHADAMLMAQSRVAAITEPSCRHPTQHSYDPTSRHTRMRDLPPTMFVLPHTVFRKGSDDGHCSKVPTLVGHVG